MKDKAYIAGLVLAILLLIPIIGSLKETVVEDNKAAAEKCIIEAVKNERLISVNCSDELEKAFPNDIYAATTFTLDTLLEISEGL